MTPAGYDHGVVIGELTWRLGQFVSAKGLGQVVGAETGFVLQRNPDTVRAPDIAFVSRNRGLFSQRPAGFPDEVPDLAVEVLSPNDKSDEVSEKVLDWLRAGCRGVWIVNPRLQTVTLYHSPTDVRVCTANEDLTDDTILPGFRCTVAELFARP